MHVLLYKPETVLHSSRCAPNLVVLFCSVSSNPELKSVLSCQVASSVSGLTIVCSLSIQITLLQTWDRPLQALVVRLDDLSLLTS